MKYAVITGATKGIGRALAEAMWQEGYSLGVCARTESDLRAIADLMKPVVEGQKFLWKATDVAVREEVQAFGEMILSSWEKVDVLVNNAGLFTPGEILSEEEGVLEFMLNTNLVSAYHLTRALIPHVKKSRGHIFTMCSVASIIAYPDGGSYSISKFGLLGFTKVLREETKKMGIKVTAVISGSTWSDSWKGADYPRDRLMEPADIVEASMSALRMGPTAVVEEILIRPQLGDL